MTISHTDVQIAALIPLAVDLDLTLTSVMIYILTQAHTLYNYITLLADWIYGICACSSGWLSTKIHAYSIYIASDMAVQGGRHNYTDAYVCMHVACMPPLAVTYVFIITYMV